MDLNQINSEIDAVIKDSPPKNISTSRFRTLLKSMTSYIQATSTTVLQANNFKPLAIWNGTKLKLQNPDGSYTPEVDLVGPAGPGLGLVDVDASASSILAQSMTDQIVSATVAEKITPGVVPHTAVVGIYSTYGNGRKGYMTQAKMLSNKLISRLGIYIGGAAVSGGTATAFSGQLLVKVFLNNALVDTVTVSNATLNTKVAFTSVANAELLVNLNKTIYARTNDLLTVAYEHTGPEFLALFYNSAAVDAAKELGANMHTDWTVDYVGSLTAKPTFSSNNTSFYVALKTYSVVKLDQNVATLPLTTSAVAAMSLVDKTNYIFAPRVANDANIVYNSSNSFRRKAQAVFLKGLTVKNFNAITIPLVRNLVDETFFTDGITVKVFLRSDVAITKVIPFSDLAYYNTLTRTDTADKFDYTLILDTPLVLNPGDILYVGWECNALTDKTGSLFKFNTASDATEFSRNYNSFSDVAGAVSALSAMPVLPASNIYYLRVSLGYATSKLPVDPVVSTNLATLNSAVALNTSFISAVSLIDKTNYSLAARVTNDAAVVWSAGQSYRGKGMATWFKGLTAKNFNAITIPLVRNLFDEQFFTDGVTVKIFLRTDIAITKVIPFSELAYYNTLGRTDTADKFDYTLILDTPLVLNPGDTLYIGWECIAATDKLGSLFKFNTASDATEFSRNYNSFSNVAGAISGLIAMPGLPASTPFYIRVSLGYASAPSAIKGDYALVAPKKVYTVCNDLVAASKGYNRNMSAAVYLDHMLTGLTTEVDAKFDATKSDKLVFTSKIVTTDANDSTQFNEGLTVKTYDVSVAMIGNEVKKKTATIKHISTLASANKAAFPKVLCLGDSITWGELAGINGSTSEADVYWLLAQQLLDMDRVDNGLVAGQLQSLFVGQVVAKTRTYSYNGSSRTIKGFAEGRRGWKLTDYLGQTATGQSAANPFYNAAVAGNAKFSLLTWLNKYRTLANDGVTRLVVGSTAGTSVTDVNAYDVCVPTHIVVNLGANDNDPVNYVQGINDLKAAIKAEYAANGWGVVNIAVVLPDYNGTFFPSKYPAFGESAAFWKSTNNHAARWQMMKNYVDTVLAADTEDADRVHLLPFYWVQPTAWSVAYRSASLPDAMTTERRFDSRIEVDYGWVPFVHPNGIAHWNFAYQLYSWLKYTHTL
ncbi:hypothetical protein [Spirosoma endophyticum]|uniref:Uncharacterized protein n=1 Tax=Spirosoma endophyticum TaxID=662367 RepID=A0A1I1SU07_9BACT|nr:hypothetical protein [Spirosoma endophyticum]SFD47383.1 hypothetical protein SAMN05216167_105153 [Spirosoma endophyticum]